ncbi:unnamed protein product [Ixodes hexagonus]
MTVKICSYDRKIKKLAAVINVDALKKKAVEFGVCRHGDIKVYLLHETEVDEEAFICLAQSSESATHTVIATTNFWVSGKYKHCSLQEDVPSPCHEGGEEHFASRLKLPWDSLSHDVRDVLQEGAPLSPAHRQEVVRMAAAACQKVKGRPSARDIRKSQPTLR